MEKPYTITVTACVEENRCTLLGDALGAAQVFI